MTKPFEYLVAPLETPDGWFMLLDRDHADPDKFQGFDENTGALKYDGCRCDNFHGPFPSLEALYKFAVNDLIDLIRECHSERDNDGKKIVEQAFEKDELRQEIKRLKKWVDDLHSGMYVNCVYCGHQYGPKETTPVSMADALKAHIEQCPKHPMSALKAENTLLQQQVTEQVGTIRSIQEAANHLIDALVLPGHHIADAWEKALILFGRYCLPYASTCPEKCVPDDAQEDHDA